MDLVDEAEEALAQGEPETARSLLEEAAAGPMDDARLVRLVTALAQANRFLSRHRETVKFIDGKLGSVDGKTRAVLLRIRIAALRQFDTQAVLAEADAALAAAEAAGDLDSY